MISRLVLQLESNPRLKRNGQRNGNAVQTGMRINCREWNRRKISNL